MLILLPPSETKRDGGDGGALDLESLGFPALGGARRTVIEALGDLAADAEAMGRALKLRGTLQRDVERNRRLRTAPTMAAMDRYTGVLFDALAPAEASDDARSFLERTVVVHSALFGLVRSHDAIPAYRLSHDSRLPGVRLRRLWRDAIAAELAQAGRFVLDLRSEAYAALGPAPENSAYLRVVTRDGSGQVRALNHFNKKGKGEFVARLALAGLEHDGPDSLVDWARSERLALTLAENGELVLEV